MNEYCNRTTIKTYSNKIMSIMKSIETHYDSFDFTTADIYEKMLEEETKES